MSDLKEFAAKGVIYLFSFCVVLYSGSIIFTNLESSQKEVKIKLKTNLLNLQNQLVNKCVSIDTLNSYADLRREYLDFQGGLDSNQAFRLSLSIAFTTGWGTYVPTTESSKVFFLFYSCISISIATLMLNCIGEIVHELIYRIVKFTEQRALGRPNVKKVYLKSFILSLFLLLLFIVLNSALFVHKGFSILDAVYDCFQAYTTIGFGDLEGEEKLHESSHWTVISIFLVNMIGMSLLATVIKSLVKYQERAYSKAEQRLKVTSLSVFDNIGRKIGKNSKTKEKKHSRIADHDIGFHNPSLHADTVDKTLNY